MENEALKPEIAEWLAFPLSFAPTPSFNGSTGYSSQELASSHT